MLKLFTDFNDMTSDGICWLLMYGDTDLEKLADELHLKRGDKVTLFQDEDDFEVTATLDFRYVEFLARETWVAVPDWSTIVDL